MFFLKTANVRRCAKVAFESASFKDLIQIKLGPARGGAERGEAVRRSPHPQNAKRNPCDCSGHRGIKITRKIANHGGCH